MRYLSILALGWMISCLMFNVFGQSSITTESCQVVTTSSDTIYANEKFLGVTYTKVGPHDGIIEHLTSKEGCDSVVTHRLIVKPDPTVKEYYVRVDGEGNGSGWDKSLAMNGEDFATYLPLVPDGTTFHVAEGTYHPYDFPRAVNVFPWVDNDGTIRTDLYDDKTLFAFYVKGNNISILGGYPKNPSKGEPRMPDIYKALFSGDLDENDQWYQEWENVDNILRFNNNFRSTLDNSQCLVYADKADGLTLSGITFESIAGTGRSALILNSSKVTIDNCIFTHNYASFAEGGASCISMINKCVLNIGKSLFEQNIVSSNGLIVAGYRGHKSEAEISVKNSSFIDNVMDQGGIPLFAGIAGDISNLLIDKCTIYKNRGYANGIVEFNNSNRSTLKVYNSTIVSNHFFGISKNEKFFYLGNESSCEMINNTFLDNSYQSHSDSGDDPESNIFLFAGKNDISIKLYGNIMWDEGPVNLFYNWSDDIVVDEKYNLFSGFRFNGSSAPSFEPDETDIYLGEDAVPLSSIGGMEATSDYDPVVKNNGGFTPTVALKSDETLDGKSIRFPLDQTSVTQDQRGESRLDMTCMGAYELKCNDTIYSHDTIQVGEEFLGVTYTKVGLHDSIFQKVTVVEGCDRIVMHSLIVKPDPTKTEYYVKVDGEGDGHDWEHAMNGEDFATYLPLVPDGTTFYVAQGTYHPIYDKNLTKNKSTSTLCYLVNSDVSIRGGYPSNPEKDAISEPEKYTTIFDGDILGDDGGDLKLDNVNNLFIIQESSNTSLYGVSLNSSYQNNYGAIYVNGSLDVRRCAFSFNQSVIYGNENTIINVDSCEFYHNESCYSGSVLHSLGSLSVANSYFQQNATCFQGSCVNFEGTDLSILNCTFYSNTITGSALGACVYIKSGNCIIGNSTFRENILKNPDSRSVNDVYVEGGSCKFVNNTVYRVGTINNPLVYASASSHMEMIGNIIYHSNGRACDVDACPDLITKYNLTTEDLSDKDIKVTDKDTYKFLLDVENGFSYKVEVGESQYVGGFALINDTLPDGTGIRFPLSETIVTTDQRGEERLKLTCMGAYELLCKNDTTFVSDTISIGDEFLGKTYTSMGRYDSIFVNLKDLNGCDSVVMHTIFVKPDAGRDFYFVKTDRHGKADGSSWDDAISGEDFAFALPMVNKDVKFYIAEGTYYPVYDKNLSIPSIGYNKVFYASKGVSLYGGFPAGNEGKDMTCDPALYPTIFSGDIQKNDTEIESFDDFNLENRWENTQNVLLLSLMEDGTINIDGIVFTGNADHGRGGFGAFRVSVGDNTVNCNISKCRFTQVTYGASIEGCTANITDCYFDKALKALSLIGGTGGNVVTRNTFDFCSTSAVDIWGNNTTYDVSNNTFTKMNTALLLSGEITCNLRNNTIWGDVSSYEPAKLEMVGNIIGGEMTGDVSTSVSASSYNLFAKSEGEWTPSASDIVTTQEALLSILDNEEGQPKLNDNGGLTPTVALKRITLPEDINIRFPLIETTVTEDQRGEKREDMTCAGAYEFICSSDTTLAAKFDTIHVGESFMSVTYEKMGRYDDIYVNLQGVSGCDSVVKHTLIVKPDPTNKAYYVKIGGTGDGKNWKEAMSPEDFALCLPLAPDGATFYVAQGNYHPIYDSKLLKPESSSSLNYTINSNVTIRGGYPTDPDEGAESEPDKYQTIFETDVIGDDVISESLDEDGYPQFNIKNSGDNAGGLFISLADKELKVTFDGVVIRKANTAISILSPNNKLELLNSTFEYNSTAVTMPYAKNSLYVYNTSFKKNSGNVIYMPMGMEIVLDSVLFEDNVTNTSSSRPSIVYGNYSDENEGKQRLLMNKVKAIHNKSNVFANGYDVVVDSSLFESNSTIGVGMLRFMGHENNIEVKNTKFLQNNGGIIQNMQSSNLLVDSCSFINNEEGQLIECSVSGTVKGEPTKLQLTNSVVEGYSHNTSMIYSLAAHLNIANNTFIDNQIGKHLAEIRSYEKVSIVTNMFENNDISGNMFECPSINAENAPLNIDGNTMWENHISGSMIHTVDENVLSCSNNTIASNDVASVISSNGSPVNLYNNTIVGNSVEEEVIHELANQLTMYGNIILGNINSENDVERIFVEYGTLGDVMYNIIPDVEVSNSCDYTPDPSNIISFSHPEKAACENFQNIKDRSQQILTTLYRGTYNSSTGIFTPELNRGSSIPTVVLKKDEVLNSKSVRFPLTETIVMKDQRGENRFEQTCMGSYEMICSEADTFLTDTVELGTSYTFAGKEVGSSITKPGLYRFMDTLVASTNCDSIVTFELAVRPEAREDGYFVKVKGTGDGYNWDDAMSAGRFDTLLPLFPEGTKVFIAAGTYETKETKPFHITGKVSLTGGFPADATEGALCMPDEYETILSVDGGRSTSINYYDYSAEATAFNYKDDGPSVLTLADGADADLFGIVLTGSFSCDQGAITMDNATIHLDRCTIRKNAGSAIKAGPGSSVSIVNCSFLENIATQGAVLNLEGAKLEASRSIFELNKATDMLCETGGMGGVAWMKNSDAKIENCTFANNSATEGGVFALDGTSISLTHNTISGVRAEKGSIFSSVNSSSISLWGNMIVGNQFGYCDKNFDATVLESNYNIFDDEMPWTTGEKDLRMKADEIMTILDGRENDGFFVPKTIISGGYTKTIPVIASVFSGGEVKSVDRAGRRVETDQRGFIRMDSCCIGAFEFPTLMGYYVKTVASGDGSGSSWENAMNDTTFAYYFPIAPTGATFHIAAGTYRPIFDENGKKSKSLGRSFCASRPINLIGGYPANAKGDVEADPTQYRTILSVDYKDDDMIRESSDEYSAVEIDQRLDNGYNIITIANKLPGWSTIRGIEFRGQMSIPKGSSAALSAHAVNEKQVHYQIEQCRFVGCYIGATITGDSIIVSECRFDSMLYMGLAASSYNTQGDKGYLTIDRSSFTASHTGLNLSDLSGEIIITNSTFAGSNYDIQSPSGFYIRPENTSLELYNNTFFANPRTEQTITLFSFVPSTWKGNLFSRCKLYVRPDYDGKYDIIAPISDYNIYTSEPEGYDMGAHDTIVPPASIAEVIDGKMKDEVFIPNLAMDKGITRSADLIHVKFTDGGGLKNIPQGTTPVTIDQRQTPRAETYCRGAVEADCRFNGTTVAVSSDKNKVCRGEEVSLTLKGLTELQKNTYTYQWTSDDPQVTFTAPESLSTKAALKGQYNPVEMQLTVTNICGEDTTYTLSIEVNGTGDVPFSGLGDEDYVCFGEGEPIELSSEVEGAQFSGECITDGHFFDPTLAAEDYTTVRCYVTEKESGCDRYTEKSYFIKKKDESIAAKMQLVSSSAQTCGRYPNGTLSFKVDEWRDDLTYRVVNDIENENIQIEENVEDNSLSVKFDSIHAGMYHLYVSDGCYDYDSIQVEVEDQFSVSSDDYIVHNVECKGGHNGYVKFGFVDHLGLGFDYLFDKIEGESGYEIITKPAPDTLLFDSLSVGTYLLQIMTKNPDENCLDTFKFEFPITEPTEDLAFDKFEVVGEGCDAKIIPHLKGYAGDKSPLFQWTYIYTGRTFETGDGADDALLSVGVGSYSCTVAPSSCQSITGKAKVGGSDEIIAIPELNCEATDELCKDANNGNIKTIIGTSEFAPMMTIVAENLETNEKFYASNDQTAEVISSEVINGETVETIFYGPNILIDNLAPGNYHVEAFMGSPECITASIDFDTTLTILPMLNELQFKSLDSIHNAVCLEEKDAAAYITAWGVAKGKQVELYQGEKLLSKYNYTSLKADTAKYAIEGIISGDYEARITSDCDKTVSLPFTVGGTQPFVTQVDSANSHLEIKCPMDSTGVIAARFSGGADSCRCEFFKMVTVNENGQYVDRYKYASTFKVYRDRTEDNLIEEMNKYGVKCDATREGDEIKINYSNLTKGKYKLALSSLIPGCSDHKSFYIEIKGPNDVRMQGEVLRISCSGFHDGQVSFQARRSGTTYNYAIRRDSVLTKMNNGFDLFYVYKEKKSMVDETEQTVGREETEFEQLYFAGDQSKKIVTRINKVFDDKQYYYEQDGVLTHITGGDLKSLKDTYKDLYFSDFSQFQWYQCVNKEEDEWKNITGDIVTPVSSDEDENWFFSSSRKEEDNDTIKVPVWSCSHLETFWADPMGEFFDLNAISVANLTEGTYKVAFVDSVGCNYSETFDVKNPKKVLKIDEVVYDEAGNCDPKLRYITVSASGGWGGYHFSVNDPSQPTPTGKFDGYIGGEYIMSDDDHLKGEFRSEFLLPGTYTIRVVDQYGCFAVYDKEIVVKSEFTAKADTVHVICPLEEDAPVVLEINDPNYSGTHNVYEYVSPRLENSDPNFSKDDYALRREDVDKDTLHFAFGGGTHGMFIYRTSEDGCGTYVPSVVQDTIPPMRISIDSYANVSCHEQSCLMDKSLNSDGWVKFQFYGGNKPYRLYRNDELNDDYTQPLTNEVKYKKEEKKIGTAEFVYATIEDLSKGKYYFTLVDDHDCKRYLGADETFTDTVVDIKEPDSIRGRIYTSAICPRFDNGIDFVNTQGDVVGSIWSEFVSGGTPSKLNDYHYIVYANGKEQNSSDGDGYFSINGEENKDATLKYVIEDSLGCQMIVDDQRFLDTEINVDRIDFLVSTYGHAGDIYALIDLCAPEKNFEGVNYTFDNPKYELLDKRMYIYDIDNGPKEARKQLRGVLDTRTEVPDAFFIKNFRLIDSLSYLYNHINFVRVNDNTGTHTGSGTVWRKCHVTMTASFAGCQYTTEKMVKGSDVIVAFDGWDPYNGGVTAAQKEIMEVEVDPNPYKASEGGSLNVRVTLGAQVDFTVYVYNMGGELTADAVDTKASQLTKAGDFYEKQVTINQVKSKESQVFVILVVTKHDAESKLLLVE